MNNCTLIIDGNWLLMSRLGPKMSEFSVLNDQQQLQAASDDLVDFLAQSVNKVINLFEGNIDNILMVQDGGSWRKHYPKPKLYTDEYKANRQRAEEVDWSYIWKALNSFCNNFQENNITCTQAPGIEGDDWCWFWSRWCNRNNINTIIWTSDCDLKQLVQCDPVTSRWTAWFNDRAGLVLNKYYDTSSLSEVDQFFNFELEDPQIRGLVENMKQRGHAVSYIEPDDIRMDKIICGDAGDNIKAIVRIPNGKRICKVSSKEWNVVRESLNINNLQDLIDNREEVIDNVKHLKRFTSCTDSNEDIMDMLDYNFHMVVLDESYIPQEQRDIMESQIDNYKVADLEYLRNNYRVLSNIDGDIEDLFSGIDSLI